MEEKLVQQQQQVISSKNYQWSELMDYHFCLCKVYIFLGHELNQSSLHGQQNASFEMVIIHKELLYVTCYIHFAFPFVL